MPGTENIQTKQNFGNCQLHIEWRTPKKDVKEGKTSQQNGNSGIYLMSKYEVQVLNSYNNKTNPYGQAGAIYSQHPPLVNASIKPGKWQTYDIIFTTPRFHAGWDSKKSRLHDGLTQWRSGSESCRTSGTHDSLQ